MRSKVRWILDTQTANEAFYGFLKSRAESDSKNINSESGRETSAKNLSVFFATLCVIDLFGVFPIVALPEAIISCGPYGIPLVVFVIIVQIYTGVILGKCWIIAEKLEPSIVEKNRYPYAAIAELTYGKYMSVFVTFLLDITVFGGGIPNLLVASQNLQLLGLRISEGSFNLSFCLWLIVIGIFICPIMWLGSPKNMKELATVSVITTSCVAILTWYCIEMDKSDANTSIVNIQDMKVTTFSVKNLLKAYGIIAFQFDIHPMLLTIQMDMRRNERENIGIAVSLGIIVTVILSTITTLLAAFKYGSSTTPNILEILPRSWSLYVIIFLVTVQLCLSSAIGNSALFQHIEDILSASRDFTIKRCLIRSSLVCLAVIIGELLPRFDMVMGLIGGTLTGPLIFILPPLFFTRILHLEDVFDRKMDQLDDDGSNFEKKVSSYGTITYSPASAKTQHLSRKWRSVRKYCEILHSDCLISILVISFGLIATFATTYFNVAETLSIISFSSPCIQKLTNDSLGIL
ncbi:proton-coupled amino acid transporter 3 [Phlebotomus argentipes]|uniref:proton-coupled amino acid transporter 3 n=1 Tax=Phlebotomus argentipes TaxID=94469 RepID=UPI0028937A71|nr:proton-coupled amino acid transporter 3 [Phlebotomus argentipes]